MEIKVSENGGVTVFQYEEGVSSGENRVYGLRDFLSYYGTFRDHLETFWYRITKLMPSQTGTPVEYNEPVFNPDLNYPTLGDFLSGFGNELHSDIRLIRLMKSNFEGIFTSPSTGPDENISRPVAPRSEIKHENLWNEFGELALTTEEFSDAVMGILFSEGSNEEPPSRKEAPIFKDFFQSLCLGIYSLIDVLFHVETAVMSVCFSNEPDPIVGPSVGVDFGDVPDPGSMAASHKIMQESVKVVDVTPKVIEGPEVRHINPEIIYTSEPVVETPMTVTNQPDTITKSPMSVSLKDLGIEIGKE